MRQLRGITIFRKLRAPDEAHNLPLTAQCANDLTVQLLAAVPNRSYLEVHAFPINDFVAEKLGIVDRDAVAPERSGHGVDLDWGGLERHRNG